MGVAASKSARSLSDERRFAAFISYSHADASAAAALQRKLERYRLPKRIAEAHSDRTQSLGVIFRDREDLAAASSLSAAIRDAISRADALIVICSPDAVASQWVAAEIELFRQLHADRPILAVLLSGDPASSFPEALTKDGNEPLAADLRPDGDGPQLGFLKIVAGIAGIPLDSLIQRDAQRRIRRVMAITAGAIAAMLVMGIMTAFAISARNEAARQRAAAEGLVEYMLTDLRTKLRGVGRLDVMDAVNDRAMEYYSSQGALEGLSPDSLERRARILHAMGEDDGNSGNRDAAIAKFREAHRATQALLQQDPANPDRIFAHAQSEYWVGQAAWNKRDRPTTQRHWDAYARLASKLIEVDPDPARANLEMGYALGNLCDLYQHEGYDRPKAIALCKKSIEHERLALKAAPDSQEILTALANRYGWLADVYLASDDFPAARAARIEERTIAQRLLSDDPNNFDLRFRRTWPELGLGMIDMKDGKLKSAAQKFAEVAGEMSALDRIAPGNVQLNRAMAKAWFHRAEVLRGSDPASSRAALAQSRQIIEGYERKHGKQAIMEGFRPGFAELENKLKQ